VSIEQERLRGRHETAARNDTRHGQHDGSEHEIEVTAEQARAALEDYLCDHTSFSLFNLFYQTKKKLVRVSTFPFQS
jgi:hypothetical protein